MANILTHIDFENDLTYHIVNGSLTMQEFEDEIEDYFNGDVTKDVVWDFRNGSLPAEPYEKYSSIFDQVFKYAYVRKGGKTVVLVKKDVDYGFSRMSQTIMEMKQYEFDLEICYNAEDVEEYLGKKVDVNYRVSLNISA